MLRDHEHQAAGTINLVLEELGYGNRPLAMRPIPFSGSWGTSTSVAFQIANEVVAREPVLVAEGLSKKEARQRQHDDVLKRAVGIADEIAARLSERPEFAKVESVKGYVNLYFPTQRLASEVVQAAIGQGPDFGRGARQSDRVMIEFSQPNTHKAFHIGHTRNVSLGNALANIVEFAGYETIRANYIGDIGMHVIRCLWCLQNFHAEDQVPGLDRGRWLGEIYTESVRRLGWRKEMLDLLHELSNDDSLFVEKIDRLMKQAYDAGAVGEDVAYLLGQIANQREIKPDAVRGETIEIFWPLIGPQLQEELAYVQEHGPQKAPPPASRTAVVRNPLPEVTEENTQERYERWQRLGRHADWWGKTAGWEQQVRDLFQAWERKDPEFVQLWTETKDWSMQEFHRIYDELGVRFDVWFYESEVEETGREMVGELLEREIAEVSEGLTVVKIDEKLGLEKEKYRTLPILRSDGTTLYSTKDLALTREKFEEYKIDRSIWVVDVRQSLYFQQIFKIMELWGFKQAEKCFHLGYETVVLPEGAMSSRSGTVVLYEDVAVALRRRALEIIEEKNPDGSLSQVQKEAIAHDVGIGSLIYSMVAKDNNTVIVFNMEEALSFAGHAAPYIQYAHARACRIIDRAGGVPEGEIRFDDPQPQEIDLIERIGGFPAEVERAAESYRPLIIADYVYGLARTFNDFYADFEQRPILNAPEPQRTMRLALVGATRQTLANGLRLLGVAAPEVM
jgi:arginyl-tRNA synthetase